MRNSDRPTCTISLSLKDSSTWCFRMHSLNLSDPDTALSECVRVLRPGGMLAVCTPDWGGFLLSPSSDSLESAVKIYTDLQYRNGGDPFVGRKLSGLFEKQNLERITSGARYEVYDSLELIGNYLALQLESANEANHAQVLRTWATSPNGMFAQSWVHCLGTRPR